MTANHECCAHESVAPREIPDCDELLHHVGGSHVGTDEMPTIGAFLKGVQLSTQWIQCHSPEDREFGIAAAAEKLHDLRCLGRTGRLVLMRVGELRRVDALKVAHTPDPPRNPCHCDIDIEPALHMVVATWIRRLVRPEDVLSIPPKGAGKPN